MEEGSTDLWTQFLELVLKVIAPVWNDLIPLLPLAMLGLFLLVLGLIVRSWMRAGRKNRSRIPPRLTPLPPEGVHLPGPSPWPFIAPIGVALILVSLVFGDGGVPVSLPLFGAGMAFIVVGLAGWYLDAGREWRGAESPAGHGGGSTLALERGGTMPTLTAGAITREPPPGVHLPGPSPWPFFGPIGLFFVFMGLIFGPALIIGGILMAIIAVIGWLRDAGSEYRQVEAGHLPEPRSRDAEEAFPKRLVPVYGAIAFLAIAVTLLPVLFAALPSNAGGAGGSGGPPPESPDPAPMIAAESVTSFTVSRLVVPADSPIQLSFDNRQSGVPHNVAILQGSTPAFTGDVFPGPEMRIYEVPPLAAGEYTFVCSVHPPMTGTLVAR